MARDPCFFAPMVEYNGVSIFIDNLVQVRDPDYGVAIPDEGVQIHARGIAIITHGCDLNS